MEAGVITMWVLTRETLDDALSAVKKLSLTELRRQAGNVVNYLKEIDELLKLYPKLRTHPWMTKRAAEAVANKLAVGNALQPTLCYNGVLSIYNYIESRNP